MTATDLRTAFADLSDALTRSALADWLLEHGSTPEDDDTAAALRSGARVAWTRRGTPRRLTPETACKCDVYSIADAYGLHYSGDVSAIKHGGYFYSVADWDEGGTAEFVELYGTENCPRDADSHETLLILTGRFDKPNNEKDMRSALRFIGFWDDDEEPEQDAHNEIEAVKDWCGAFGYETYLQGDMTAKVEVWAHVLPMLERIAPRRVG